MRLPTPVLPLALAGLLSPGACASSSATECHVGADCASGVCESNGTCQLVGTTHPDGGVDAAPEVGPASDSGPGKDAASSGDSSGGGCTPNKDGTITRAELPLLAGLHGSFVVAENVTVDSAGVTHPDGTRSWDLSGALAGDHTIVVTTDLPTGQWFSSQFSGAGYTTKLSDTSTLLGVMDPTATSLLLQGVVSPTSGASQTEETYTPPAELLAVPMQMGTTWSTTSTIQGTASGVATYYTEQYASKVDARGTLKVPYGTFDVLRVQTTLTRTVGALVTVTQSLTFVAECAGPVAALTSQTATVPSPAPPTEFTSAAEARRLTP